MKKKLMSTNGGNSNFSKEDLRLMTEYTYGGITFDTEDKSSFLLGIAAGF